MRNIFLTLLCFINLFSSLFAQNKHYFGVFPTLDHSGKLSKNWGYNSYNFVATKSFNSSPESPARILYIYTENGLHLQLKPKLSITMAYVYERQSPFEESFRNEHRLFHQITLKNSWKTIGIKQRLRLDERWINNKDFNRYEFSHRIRYLLGLNKDINDWWYVYMYTEFFLQSSAGFQFNENWSSFQLGRQLTPKNKIEIGYLYVSWIYNDAKNWFNQHYVQITWVNQLNFKKKL